MRARHAILSWIVGGTCLLGPAAGSLPAAHSVLARSTTGESTAVSRPTSPRDIQLGAGNELRGLLVDATGQPVAQAPVKLHRGTRLVAETITGDRGEFTCICPSAGVYDVICGDGVLTARCWGPASAPPSARQVAVLTTGPAAIRGQFGLAAPLAFPTVTAGAVAAGATLGGIGLANRSSSDGGRPRTATTSSTNNSSTNNSSTSESTSNGSTLAGTGSTTSNPLSGPNGDASTFAPNEPKSEQKSGDKTGAKVDKGTLPVLDQNGDGIDDRYQEPEIEPVSP